MGLDGDEVLVASSEDSVSLASSCCACNRYRTSWKVLEADIYSCSRILMELVHCSAVAGSNDDAFLAAELSNNTWS